MANKPQKKYVIHEDTLYEEENKGLYTGYKKYKLPVYEPRARWTGPKIPFSLWQEMVAWCQITQKKFKSEALVFLFLDVETSEWSAWYLPQITNGMTVKADEDHENYAEQRKQFPDLQFGSLHHHCTSSAFASGVDQADEKNREGLHFTIGDLGSSEHSVHYRFCIEGQCHEGPASEVIEYHPDISNVPAKYRERIHEDMIKEQYEGWEEKDFEEQLKNISKPKYQAPKYGKKAWGGPRQHPETQGIGGKITQATMWDQEEITTEAEILAFIEEDLSLEIAIGNDLEVNGYTTQTYQLDVLFEKILKYWNKSYISVTAEERRDEMIGDVIYTLTNVPLYKQSVKLKTTVYNTITSWLREFNNEK